MKAAAQNATSRGSSKQGWIRRTATTLVRWIDNLSISEKLYGIVALLVVVTMFLLVMSIQSVRMQSAIGTWRRCPPGPRSISAASTP